MFRIIHFLPIMTRLVHLIKQWIAVCDYYSFSLAVRKNLLESEQQN